MGVKEIKPGILAVGTQDPEREVFDELVPLSEGTSYNSYLVRGSEKTALIDTNEPEKEKEFLQNLKDAKLDKLDYVIANHAEQDHSGMLPKVLELYPGVKVVTNEKCKAFLIDLLHLQEGDFKVVADKEELSLGDKTLQFHITPWTHWPETMMTYLKEDKILFSCDLFGSHDACDELCVIDEDKTHGLGKLYYAEIMMPFRKQIAKYMDMIDEWGVEIICPSHGPVHDKPEFIMKSYRDWISDDVKNEVVVAYVSMHGSTKVMAEYLNEAIKKRGIETKFIDLGKAGAGEEAVAFVDAATVVIGTPTVLAGPHPSALTAAYLLKVLRPKTRFVGLFGSYGWGGQTENIIKGLLEGFPAEFIGSAITKGLPKEEDLKVLDELADKIAEKHKGL